MKTTLVNNEKYLSVVYRGTEYMLMRMGDSWGVSTKRLALSRFSAGGFKYFDTLAEVKAKCKAFANLDLISAF
jgi:hypothetical protein